MAGLAVAETLLGLPGKFLTAPLGTSAPADEAASWPSGWVDAGYTDEDGVKWRDSKTVAEFRAWNSFWPIRRSITARNFQVMVTLLQFNKVTMPFALGGAVVSTLSTGHYKIAAPAAATLDEKAVGVEWVDGSNILRLILPKGLVTDQVESDQSRSKLGKLPIVFGIEGSDSADAYYFLTNMAGFA